MPTRHQIAITSRCLAYLMVSALFLYLINNYLVYWQDMPGPYNLLSHYEFAGLEVLELPLSEEHITRGWFQFTIYLTILLLSITYTIKTATRSLCEESVRLATLASYIIRLSFWSVMLVGFFDMIISLLRVENFLDIWVGEFLGGQLGRPVFRGTYVHFPLIFLSAILATALAKRPTDRFCHAGEFGQRIEELLACLNARPRRRRLGFQTPTTGS